MAARTQQDQPLVSDHLLEVGTAPEQRKLVHKLKTLQVAGLLTATLLLALGAALASRRFWAEPAGRQAVGSAVDFQQVETQLYWKDGAGRCLTVKDSGVPQVQLIVLETCNAAATQTFIVDKGLIHYKANQKLCLTVGAPLSGGYYLVLFQCNAQIPRRQTFAPLGSTIRLAHDVTKCIRDSSIAGDRAWVGPCAAVLASPVAGNTTTKPIDAKPKVAPLTPSKPVAVVAPVGKPLPAIAGAKCVGPGQDCRHSGSCCVQGMQCYVKNISSWAACQAVCDRSDGWNCSTIGERAPQLTPGAWAGEDCTNVRKCNNPLNRCVQKDRVSAYCTQWKVPSHWIGKVIGGEQGEYSVAPASSGQKVAGTSLFCLMAVLWGSSEDGLHHEAQWRKASIYACDFQQVCSSEHSPWVSQGSWNSFANTDGFVKVWKQVFDAGLWKKADWTVKVDPDTVFLPQRLRSHLWGLRPPADKPIYLKNSGVSFGFLGAIEIMSKVAMSNFAISYLDCRRTMPGTSGEDGWIKGCLDAIGVGSMTDESILRTPHDTGGCGDGSRVAFHPHKSAGDWGGCWSTAAR